MISRLIDISVPSSISKNATSLHKDKYTVLDYAASFIYGMSDGQRNRFKKMLENNIECGMSIAANYGVNYEAFIKEVKNQLKIR